MRLLDILIGMLVLFPLLADAVWFEIPGLHSLELSDLGLPLLVVALVAAAVRRRSRLLWSAAGVLGALFLSVLLSSHWALESQGFDLFTSATWKLTHGTGAVAVVALVAAAVWRWSGEPWEASFFFRRGVKLARAWLDALERAPARTLWSAAAIVGALFLWVSLLRHRAFESHGYDLGIFTNAMWNLTHGDGYVSSVKGGINLFSDHQSPLFWVLAPLFWLLPRPETLLAAQAFGLAAGGPALFYLGRAHFGRSHWASAALPWLYWPYLPLRNANAFDFHPEVFMLPLFLWAFAAFASERRWVKALGVLALIGALGAKESAAIVAVGLGIAWALTSANSWRSRWPGVALAAAGVALFFFDVKLVPRIFGGGYAYLGLYERFGGGVSDVMLAPFTQPAYFLSQLIDRERLNFLFWTLGPLGFLPLFAWRAALAALPPYLMLFLSEGDQRVRIVFHYGIEPGAALFWALPLGLAAFAQRFGWKHAGAWMLFWAVAAFGASGLIHPSAYARRLAAEVLPCLNQEVPTAASDALVPHLATRAWISYPEHLEQRPGGEPVGCVVTDLSVGTNWPLGRTGVARVLEGLPERGYHEAWRCRTFSVYELGTSGCLRCTPKCY